MVEVDNNKNIQRIVDNIKNTDTLFDNGATTGLLRSVNFGDPSNNVKQAEKQIPYAYVTTSDAIQGSRYGFGVSTNDIINYITMEYHITIVARALTNTVKSQKQLYDLLKDLRNMVESNPTFADPTTNNSPTNETFWTLLGTEPVSFVEWKVGESFVVTDNVVFQGKFYVCILDNTANDGDPIFSRSIISDVPYDTQTRGQLITSVTLTLAATVGSLGTISSGDLGTIELLSEPPDQDAEGYSRHYDTTTTLVGVAPIGDFHLFFIEIEALDSSIAFFKDKKDDREKFTITITKSSGETEDLNVHVSLIAKGTVINSVPTAVITFEVVP